MEIVVFVPDDLARQMGHNNIHINTCTTINNSTTISSDQSLEPLVIRQCNDSRMSYEIYQVYGEGSLCSAQECNNNELNRRSAVMLVDHGIIYLLKWSGYIQCFYIRFKLGTYWYNKTITSILIMYLQDCYSN